MNKGIFYVLFLVLVVFGVTFTLYKKNSEYESPYSTEAFGKTEQTELSLSGLGTSPLPGFASKYAVIGKDEEIRADHFQDNTYAVIMVNNDTAKPVVAHNVHRRIYPASMTKLMTGMCVCDAINEGILGLDDVITVSHKITFRDSDAVQSFLNKGDKISVRNLLYALMLSSYNDYTILLAEEISGSVEAFADRMNQKARAIGATCTHFVNPHGLDELDHYTTAYDMYLIVNAASKYQILRDIDTYRTYSYTYTDSYGNIIEDTAEPTNRYLIGMAELPSNISIGTWKTGTTGGAGHCLTMEAKINGQSYTMLVADSVSHNDLYDCYSVLFNYAH